MATPLGGGRGARTHSSTDVVSPSNTTGPPQLRLERRREKAFRDASPLGGLYDAASVAGHEGETVVFL